MLFNTLEFIIFWIIVVLIYYIIPTNKIRNIFLLTASYYFYASWNIAFLGILLFETVISFYVPRSFSKNRNRKKDRWILTFSIISLLLPLLCFKYLNFFLTAIGDAFIASGFAIHVPTLTILLPIGISFYTFMSIGYLVDVFKRKLKQEDNLLDYALFIGFFPQIASGPIGRGPQLIPQFKYKHPLLYRNVATGAKMMLWGFFMKLVVGDRAGFYVDTVFGNYEQHNGTSLLIATFLYTIQIYCDFAGYSLIAIGTAKTMGFDLSPNFNRPYFATTISDFWRRWHISLSTWFRDYVYFPLGGSRCSNKKTHRNLLITFLVSGLWHGAAYNFLIWGAYHGQLQVAERVFKRNNKPNGIRKVISIIITFVLVAYGWMIFYAPDFQTVKGITKGYFHLGVPYIHQTTLFFFIIGFLILMLKELKDEYLPEKKWLFESDNAIIRYISFALLAVIIVLFGVLGGGQFIYFKF